MERTSVLAVRGVASRPGESLRARAAVVERAGALVDAPQGTPSMSDAISEAISDMFAEQSKLLDERILPAAMRYATHGYGTKLRCEPVKLDFGDGFSMSLSQDVWVLPSKEEPVGEVVDVMGNIRKAIADLEQAKRTICVHPSHEERVREAVGQLDWAGLITVLVNEACPVDQIFILPNLPPMNGCNAQPFIREQLRAGEL